VCEIAIIAIAQTKHGKEAPMQQAQWLLQTLLALAALVRLLRTGRRNGWI